MEISPFSTSPSSVLFPQEVQTEHFSLEAIGWLHGIASVVLFTHISNFSLRSHFLFYLLSDEKVGSCHASGEGVKRSWNVAAVCGKEEFVFSSIVWRLLRRVGKVGPSLFLLLPLFSGVRVLTLRQHLLIKHPLRTGSRLDGNCLLGCLWYLWLH